MKKKCNKGHLYDYTEVRCPECFKQRDRFRDRKDNPYDYKWQKFRKNLVQNFEYSFCWLCLLEKNKWDYNVSYHHIFGVNEYPELKYELNNLVPVCTAHHNETEAKIQKGINQPDWKSIKQAVKEKLKKM